MKYASLVTAVCLNEKAKSGKELNAAQVRKVLSEANKITDGAINKAIKKA